MKYLTKEQIILPKRIKSSKKGDNGKVLIIGGSKDYVGALTLAGLAALRSGCDWVTVAAPEKVSWAINCLSPDLVTKKLKGDYFSLRHIPEIKKLAEQHNVILIGNGIGLQRETKLFIQKIIKIGKFKVIDADAIKSLSTVDLENSIITPHIKELQIFMENSKINDNMIKRVIGEKDIEMKAKIIRKTIKLLGLKNNNKNFFENNNVLLLKGNIDIIISNDETFFNKTGNSGMSKAGTGDVLAGLTVGFLAQSNDLLQSSINAAYYNGLIGDILLKKKKGYTYLASDMVDEIKNIMKR
jgi:ADP-dependent NAD(P)H-hydrate dehydratase / NAD(P)H-hydrate epimerase